MKKRLLSILLAIVMVVGLLPTVAFAGGSTPQPPAPAGAVFTIDDSGTMYTLADAVTNVAEGGTITMTDDFTLNTKSFQFGGEKAFTLDLAGHTITVSDIVFSGGSGSINNIKFYNPNMTVTDSSEDKIGAITAKASAQLLLRYDQFWDLTKVTADGSCYVSYSSYPSKVVYEGDLAKTVILKNNPNAICMTGGTGYETLAAAVDAGGDIIMWGEGSGETAIELASGSLTMQDGASYTGDVTVNGGTLTVESGATVSGTVTLTSGSLTVKDGATVTNIAGAEARIGEKYYKSFTDAVSKVANNQTVTVLNDVTVSSALGDHSSTTYTIDLNGKTVTFSGVYYQIYGNVNLTIKDSSNEKNGKMLQTGNSSLLYVMGSSKVTIDSGIFESQATSNSNGLIQSNGTHKGITINGGQFIIAKNAAFIYDQGNRTITINDCNLTVQDPDTYKTSALIRPLSGSSITILGGEYNIGERRLVETNQTVSIKGGSYSQDVTAYCAMGLTCETDSEKEGYYNIVPRTADNSSLYLEHTDGTKIFGDSIKNAMAEAQDGDTIVFLKDVQFNDTLYTKANDLTLDLANHKLGHGEWVNGQINVEQDMTIKNGIIECKTAGTSSAIQAFNDTATLTLSNVTVNAYGSNVALLVRGRGQGPYSSGVGDLTLVLADGTNNYIRQLGTKNSNDEYVPKYPAIQIGEIDQNSPATSSLTITGTGNLTVEGLYAVQLSGFNNNNNNYTTNTLTIDNPNVNFKALSGKAAVNGYFDRSYSYSYNGSTISMPLTISAGHYYGNAFSSVYDGGYTPATGASLFDGSQLSGGQYAFKPAAKWIADGYEAVSYNNPAYPDLHYEIVKIKQVDAGTATVSEGEDGEKTITIETHGEDKNISATKKGTTDTVATEAVATRITETLNNDAVSEFSGTKIEANTNSSLIKEELKKDDAVKNDNTAKDNIDATTNILKQITVDLTATTVDIETSGSSVKEINSMTFEVKPIARTTVVDATGAEKTVEVVIPNNLITAPLTFRLFVDSNVTAKQAAVYHGDGKDYIGLYPITTGTDGKKYIELSAKEFSLYTYETVYVDNTAVAVIPDGNGSFTGYPTLAAAIAAVTDGKTIILMKDDAEAAAIDFGSTEAKAYELDLNGHKLTGTGTNAEYVTISNNDAENPECLAVLGVFANDVSAFVVDGYATVDFDTETTGNDNRKVVDNTANNDYVVKVVTKAYDEDRDTTNDTEVKNVDLFAGDIVTAEVRVYGTHFVGAKVTFTYDKGNFTDVTEEVYGEYSDGWDYNEDTNIWEFKNAYDQPNKYYETEYDETENASYYVLGEFAFEVKAIDEATIEAGKTGEDGNGNPVMKVPFKVKAEASETYPKTYIAGAWKNGWDTNPANKITADRLFNDFANIRLKQMTASVTPETEGLVYKATGLKLLKEGYSATDNTTGDEITDAVITYALGTGDDGTTPPEASAYTATQPMPSDAGTYVVFYKIAKNGYVTVAGSEEVTIEKRPVTLTWTAADFIKGQKDADHPSDFWGSYVTGKTFNKPVVKYEDANGATQTLATDKVTMITAPTGATGLNKTGNYVFKAEIDNNYAINNPECAILIDGGTIIGYTLGKTDETTTTATGSEIWRDGTAHAAAKMTEVDSTDNDVKTQGVNITYYLSSDNGKTFSETGTSTMPEVSAVGKYVVKAVLSKEGYYTQEQFHQITIKSVEYYTEKTDYVVGWDMVLVYTNESVPAFTYDGHAMYDVSTLGYKYGTQYDEDGKAIAGQEGTAYTHVYAILVYGVGDTSKVVPSNIAGNTLTIYKNGTPTTLERNDVNESGAPDLNDLVAVQAVYNVDTKNYLNDEQMHIALKCDVTGNKMVDMSDYAQIKTKF